MTFAEAQRAIYIDFECLMGRVFYASLKPGEWTDDTSMALCLAGPTQS